MTGSAGRRPAGTPWLSAVAPYASILVLQLKVVWKMWVFKDLTAGDTADYFLNALRWWEHFQSTIAWSPLYTSFYGSFLFVSRDAYAVTIAHRLVIVFAATILLLALLRRLLPPWLAWLAAAWWAMLPTNFDTLYEVHLFSVLPLLAIGLVLGRDSMARRGWGTGLLAISTSLVRNELLPGALLFGMAACWYDSKREPGARVLRAYAIPLLVAAALFGWFYSRSTKQFPELAGVWTDKHTINMCQVYAFSYQQRHPEWTASPWTACQPLIESTFGVHRVTFIGAMISNPGATLEHLAWNASLLGNGLQVLLFGSTSGSVNPDYVPVVAGSSAAALLTLLLALLLVSGGVALWRERGYWWTAWIGPRRWCWLALAAAALPTLGTVLIVRPRPSYMFSVSVLVMALAGLALAALLRRAGLEEKAFRLAPLVVIGALALAPNYYVNPQRFGPRPTLEAYRRLWPYRLIIQDLRTRFVTTASAFEVINYVRVDNPPPDASAWRRALFAFEDLLAARKPGMDWAAVLDQRQATLFYADEHAFGVPMIREFGAGYQNYGWKLAGAGPGATPQWMLFERIRR